MAKYKKPLKKIHKGFVYLDDETVANSLSAVESGKIDEVVARINSARAGGLGGKVGAAGVQVDAGRKSTNELEEEMVRTRTRFSVFELWYDTLEAAKAIGKFDGWDDSVLGEVVSGDTVEIRAVLEIAPLQTLLRLFLWYSEQAKNQNSMLAQKGEALKETKNAERNIRMILGGDESGGGQIVVLATPLGENGPKVAMAVKPEWLIGAAGRLGGEYTVVAQVDRILAEGDELPAMRLTQDVAPTPLEMATLKHVIRNFVEPADSLGMEVDPADAVVEGPALWLEPIAIYR